MVYYRTSLLGQVTSCHLSKSGLPDKLAEGKKPGLPRTPAQGPEGLAGPASSEEPRWQRLGQLTVPPPTDPPKLPLLCPSHHTAPSHTGNRGNWFGPGWCRAVCNYPTQLCSLPCPARRRKQAQVSQAQPPSSSGCRTYGGKGAAPGTHR